MTSTFVGVRVLRGPDWDQNEADGGEGHLGTVVGVKVEEGTAEVLWDNGRVTTCRIGKGDKYDLRIFDNGTAGVKHPRGKSCRSCRNSQICGMMWHCTACPNFDLCSQCYVIDAHRLDHAFLRFTTHQDEGVAVGVRQGARKVHVLGIFPEARVSRGRDWESGDADGGPDGSGVVVEVLSPESGSARNAVRVSWDSGQSLQHRLGLQGKVDLVCTEGAPGPTCYVTHLPVLACSQPKEAGDTSAATPPQSEIRVGDSVTVTVDMATLKDVQSQTSGWIDSMRKCVGGTGVVQSVLANGEMKVKFEGETFTLNAIVLTKAPEGGQAQAEGKAARLREGDTVRIISDVKRLEKQQEGHGGWVSDMAKAAGKVGIVKAVNAKRDLVVQFGRRCWVFSPESCLPASGSQVDSIQGSDGDLLSDLMGVKNHLEGLVKTLKGDTEIKPDSPAFKQLFKTIDSGDMMMLAKMLENQPDLARGTTGGATALHYAALGGKLEAVRLLVAKGSEVNKGDKDDASPLIRAIQRRRIEVAEALIKLGADVNLSNENGQTPLHIAVMANSADAVRLLLHNMASVNRRDIQGDPPLFDALQGDSTDPVIVDIFLATGDLDLSVVNKKDFNALHIAALKDRPRAASKIIARDSSLVNSVIEEGRFTPLHITAANNHTRVMKHLLDAKAAVDARNHLEGTALHLACMEDFMESASILVEHGADVNATDIQWDTPLHECFAEPNNPMSKLMSLHSGRKEKGLELAKFLIRHGARADKRNRPGQTPLDVAPEAVRGKLAVFIRQLEEPGSFKDRNADDSDKSTSGNKPQAPAKCSTCHKRDSDVIFLPCAHKVTCRQCSGSVKECRECGSVVTGRVDTEGNPVRQTSSSSDRNAEEPGDYKFKMTDRVRIISDASLLERQQRNHGDWVSDMAQAAGKVGTVLGINENGDLVVHFGQQFWVFNPKSCRPAPGCSVDFIPVEGDSGGLSHLLEDMGTGTVRLSAGDIGIKVQSRAVFTEPSELARLFKATQEGDTSTVAKLLDDDSGFVHKVMTGCTALHHAASHGQPEVARLLVAKGADLHRGDEDGDTALIRAIITRRIEPVKVLIELGSDVNRGNEKDLTPMHFAVIANSVDILRLLLQNKASVNKQDKEGSTPLLVAVHNGSTDSLILDALLAVGDLDLRRTNRRGFNALQLAALRDRPRAAERILARDASLVTSILREGQFTALHISAANDHTEVMKVLLKANAPMNARDHVNQTPLHQACSEGYVAGAKILIENGADINATDILHNTPLHACFVMNSIHQMLMGRSSQGEKGLDVAKLLIQHGARTDMRNAEGKTPLDTAPQVVREKLVRFLNDVRQGTDTNQSTQERADTNQSTQRRADIPQSTQRRADTNESTQEGADTTQRTQERAETEQQECKVQ